MKVTEAGDALEVHGEFIWDNYSWNKAGQTKVKTIKFESPKAANAWLEELKKLQPIEAAIKLTKVLERTTNEILGTKKLKTAKEQGPAMITKMLIREFGQFDKETSVIGANDTVIMYLRKSINKV